MYIGLIDNNKFYVLKKRKNTRLYINMQDIDYLKNNKRIPTDNLIDEFRAQLKDVQKYTKFHNIKPFQSYITLSLIYYVGEIYAQKYIMKLLNDQEKYGYLYYLYYKNLKLPLDIKFNSYLLLDREDSGRITYEINKIAKSFYSTSDFRYEITRLELLYFYTLLVNPFLTWITLDYLVKGNRLHSYLIGSPNRLKDCTN